MTSTSNANWVRVKILREKGGGSNTESSLHLHFVVDELMN